MDIWFVICRVLAMALLIATLVACRWGKGSSPKNVPYWIALGMASMYSCYCFFGLEFGNGQSGWAELGLSTMVAITAVAFDLGGRAQRRRRFRRARVVGSEMPGCSGRFTLMAMVAALAFFTVLTAGQPWRVLTDGVELKWERLAAATDKDASLLLMDAVVFASVLIGLSWAIIGYRDDRRSAVQLGVFAVLALLYTVSTGSRTPLIAVGSQVIAAVAYGRHNSRLIARVAASSGLIFLAGFIALAFMIAITASRIEFEQLDSAVFERYFDITKLGVVGPLTQKGSGGFFLATLITYAASTYNNAIIRLQELDAVTVSYGYKFVFFYISALKGFTGGLLDEPLMAWRELATVNNLHLLGVSASATQWATLYGDAIWDYGYPVSAALVVAVSYFSGSVIERTRRRSTLSLHLLAITLIGFTLSPLVNPFLSLHVHFMLFIVGGIHLATRRSRRPRQGGLPVPTAAKVA
jgi:hypothetical protein